MTVKFILNETFWLCVQVGFFVVFFFFFREEVVVGSPGFFVVVVVVVFSFTSLLLPTHLPPPSCTRAQSCNPMDCQTPLSMDFSRQEYWSGLHFLLQQSWFLCIDFKVMHHK